MSKFEESNFYKALQDFFINADKKTFLQFLAEFYNRTEGIINKDNIQDDLIKELRELYLEFNEKGIDENIVREKVNYFLENSVKIKDVISKLNTNTNNIENITTQFDNKANEIYIEEFSGNTDTEKIKNAIKSISDKGTIKLKNKDYNFNNFVLSEGANLIGSGNTVINSLGNGTLIKTTNNNIVSDLIINDNGYSIKAIEVGQVGGSESNYCNNSTIKNITINLTNKTSNGIRIGHGENNQVLNNTIINKATIGDGESSGIGIAIYSDTPNKCKSVFISNNYVNGFYYGISPWGTGTRINVQVDGNIVEDCVNIGINMYHSTLSQVLNNNVYNCKIGIFADTTSYNGNKGRGTIVSNNSVHKCSKIGIYCEELRGGIVSNNTVQDSNIGIYGGAGISYTSFSNNTITYNTIGLMISNKNVPTQMQNYDNISNVIRGNVIISNKQHGVLLEGVRGLHEISDNYICSNNTSNGDFYAIYFKRDVIEEIGRNRECESVIVKNNTIMTGNIDGTVGYQGGIYNASGNAGQIILLNNYLQDKNTELFLTGFNKYSVIKDNVVIGTGNITVPDCKIVNNIGIEEGNLIANSDKGVKFNLGVANKNALPTASTSECGRIIKVNRRTDDGSTYIDDEYYICIRLANGSYTWKKISLI